MTWRQVSEAILKFHEPIAHHFYTGIGLKLQRLDSDIAERVLLHFAQIHVPVLPLHDSFLMHHGYESTLGPVMEEAFEELVGVNAQIDKKVHPITPPETKYINRDHEDQETVTDISALLIDLDVGFDNRLEAFRSLQVRNLRACSGENSCE